MSNLTRRTYFFDIDGTLFHHGHDLVGMMMGEPRLIEGTQETLLKLRAEGHYIIITTARPEGLRSLTETHLHQVGVFYDQLVMGLTSGPRVLVNDTKPDGTITAIAHSIKRDSGINKIPGLV